MPPAHGEPAGPAAEGHLAGCATCRGRLLRLRGEVGAVRGIGSHAFDAADGAGQGPAPAQAAGELPRRIGRYKVLQRLGRGGQASVFLAEHPTLRQQVVVKWSPDPLPATEFDHDRLVAEARLLCELNHPNLARVYDLEAQDERPFVAMEYVRGRTLEQYAADHQSSASDAAALVAKVARAAAAAHRKGITHRDITPRNIVIDESGEPRLIDFGLALVRRAHGGVHSQTSEPAGMIAGTPGFMAPEQEAGQTSRIGPRTDVYALGAVLRYLLHDSDVKEKPGFEGSTVTGVTAVPASLRRIIARAIAADPAARYGTADELAGALEAFARGRGGAGRRVFWGGAAAAVVLAVCGAFWLHPPAPGGRGHKADPEPPRALTRQAVVARATPGVFKVISFVDVAVRTPYFARAVTTEGARRYAPERYIYGWVPHVDPAADGPTILENEYKRLRASGEVPKDEYPIEYYYKQVIRSPGRYLMAEMDGPDLLGGQPHPPLGADEERAVRPALDGGRNLVILHATPYASGTAFAVSREGVLLTNAHVVAAPHEAPAQVVLPAISRTLDALEKQFGGPCPDELKAQLVETVLDYLQANSTVIYSRFAEAVVVLDYTDNQDAHFRHRRGPSPELADYLAYDGPKDNGVSGCAVDVLAQGSPFPGKDVAVLKLRPDGTGGTGKAEQAGAAAGATTGPAEARRRDWKDKLVCLPLGDSDRFALGGNVVAFGFPGAATALGPDALEESAAFRVIPRDGTIGARERMRDGWDALNMTAGIGHGDSGGPVIDEAGNVVAINVAGAKDSEGNVGARFAVPMNVAKEFLAQTGVTPDPGPVTQHWLAGQTFQQAGHYTEAAREFEAVLQLQGTDACSEVRRALAECRKALKGR